MPQKLHSCWITHFANHCFSHGCCCTPTTLHPQKAPRTESGTAANFFPLHCWCLSSIIVPLQLPQRFLNLSLWKQAEMLGTKRPPLLHPTPPCDHHPSANSVAATETADFGVSISITGAELTFEIRQKDWSLRGELKFGTCCPPSGSWHVSAEVPSNKARGLGRLFTFSTSGNACR